MNITNRANPAVEAQDSGWRGINHFTLRFTSRSKEEEYRAARSPSEVRYMRVVLIFVLVLTLAVVPLDLLLFPETGEPLMVVGHGSEIGLLIALFAASFVPRFKNRHRVLIFILAIFFAMIYAVWNAVFNAPDMYVAGGVLVIVAIYVLLPFDFIGGLVCALLCTVLYLAIIKIAHPMHNLPFLTLSFFMMIGNAIGGVSLYHIERLRRLDFANLREIDAQRVRYRDLLVRILPQPIADRLQKGEAGIADRFDDATVLFADLVGFTTIASRHAPEQVVAFLDRVFASFDILVDKFGAEKIKTIGDAYMVASGVPKARPDHASAIADLALEMRNAAASVKPLDGARVELRIGIGSGPVVAGIIGDKRFAYDLWGDTVNVASRMESFGIPGHIQVCEKTYRQLADDYDLTPRGEIEIKGLGSVKTWYLDGRKIGKQTEPVS